MDKGYLKNVVNIVFGNFHSVLHLLLLVLHSLEQVPFCDTAPDWFYKYAS